MSGSVMRRGFVSSGRRLLCNQFDAAPFGCGNNLDPNKLDPGTFCWLGLNAWQQVVFLWQIYSATNFWVDERFNVLGLYVGCINENFGLV